MSRLRLAAQGRRFIDLPDFDVDDDNSPQVQKLIDAHRETSSDRGWTRDDDMELQIYVGSHRLWRLDTPCTSHPLYRAMNNGPQYITRAALLFITTLWEHRLLAAFDRARQIHGFQPAAPMGIVGNRLDRPLLPGWNCGQIVTKWYEAAIKQDERTIRRQMSGALQGRFSAQQGRNLPSTESTSTDEDASVSSYAGPSYTPKRPKSNRTREKQSDMTNHDEYRRRQRHKRPRPDLTSGNDNKKVKLPSLGGKVMVTPVKSLRVGTPVKRRRARKTRDETIDDMGDALAMLIEKVKECDEKVDKTINHCGGVWNMMVKKGWIRDAEPKDDNLEDGEPNAEDNDSESDDGEPDHGKSLDDDDEL